MKIFLMSLIALMSGGCASASTFKTGTTAIDYHESGNANGVPVVFVHAFPLNQAMWADQILALDSTARVLTFDIRGLGKSELNGPYTLEFVVDDLIALLDRLKIKKAVVVGLSMGGFVAIRAVERNPERFLGLVLADTKAASDSDHSKLGRYKSLKAIQENGLSAFIDSFLKTSFMKVPDLEKRPYFIKATEIANHNTAMGVSAALLALTSRTDTTDDLKNINIPTLILHGEFDGVIQESDAEILHNQIKNSDLFIVPNAGHLSNLENPDFFNDHLTKFIKSL